ncbi:unnamed protein product [Didymodactylos carnosus]|uniref:Uncharacterized protein n=1 Tax=Didymodactylos carnosus TaxID=1234261 RepID=A0A8S2GH98_9BILA|nr:unnamed protein product [Didymodactylos carnosus]CAF3518266.1 unnamed protein product [Didymodactylos carnosus]
MVLIVLLTSSYGSTLPLNVKVSSADIQLPASMSVAQHLRTVSDYWTTEKLLNAEAVWTTNRVSNETLKKIPDGDDLVVSIDGKLPLVKQTPSFSGRMTATTGRVFWSSPDNTRQYSCSASIVPSSSLDLKSCVHIIS